MKLLAVNANSVNDLVGGKLPQLHEFKYFPLIPQV